MATPRRNEALERRKRAAARSRERHKRKRGDLRPTSCPRCAAVAYLPPGAGVGPGCVACGYTPGRDA